MTGTQLGYVIVTPVRNEEGMLGGLAESLERQTVLPMAWTIVDTGSTDGTVALATEIASRLPWVGLEVVSLDATLGRGGPVVRGFNAGVARLRDRGILVPGSLVAKVDADVRFSSSYFERLLGAFVDDPTLGIGSGICTELRDGTWAPIYGTRDHVWGATRTYRLECLDSVGPLEERQGWDEIDALRARLGGWSTRTLFDLPFQHVRGEGQRDGERRRWLDQGDTAYYMGYRPSYLVLRSFYRARREPAALLMLVGFARAALGRRERLADERVRASLRELQRLRSAGRRADEARGRTDRRPQGISGEHRGLH